jgi:hypothetical protein
LEPFFFLQSIKKKGGNDYENKEKDTALERTFANTLPVLFMHCHLAFPDFKHCESWKRRVVWNMASRQLYQNFFGNW